MPPRITRNSHRPRASDRTMVDTFSRHSKAKLVAQAIDGGLDLEKTNLDSGRGRTFFLTSLLIELIDAPPHIFTRLAIPVTLPSDSADPLCRKEFKMIQRGKIILVRHLLIISFLVGVTAIVEAFAQSVATPQKTERVAPPTRDANTAGYVAA